MEVTTKQANLGETILILSGQLNFKVRTELQKALKNAQTEGSNQVILDLTHVTFVDCAVLGILVQTKHEFSKTQIMLSLIATPGPILDVLQTMQVDKMLNIVTAKKEA